MEIRPVDQIEYKEAASLLGVPIGTLYALVARREIPHYRYFTRTVRFSRSELVAWISKHHVNGNLRGEVENA
jgi:excisionase family DNA binding protein